MKTTEEISAAVREGVIGAESAAQPQAPGTGPQSPETTTAADLLGAKKNLFADSEFGAALPEVISIPRTTTLREAVSVMNRYGIDIVPVIDQPGRVARIGEVYGIVDVEGLSDAIIVGKVHPEEQVAHHLTAELPLAGITETVPQILEKLRRNPTLLVARDGDIVGVLTRNDLLAHLSGAEEEEN